MSTIAVDVRHSIHKRGSVKEAAAYGWGGKHPARRASRVVAHDAGQWLGEFVSRGGGLIDSHVSYNRLCFHIEDMVEAEQTYPDDMRPLIGNGRLPFRRLV